jgi:hypothetical protein
VVSEISEKKIGRFSGRKIIKECLKEAASPEGRRTNYDPKE